MGPSRIRVLAARALIVGGVVAGILGVALPAFGPPPPPVAVVDLSASVGAGASGPPEGARVSPTWYAVADGVETSNTRSAPSGLGREASRIGEALRRVAEDHPGRVVWLISDGRATDGSAEDAARGIRARGGRLYTAPPARPSADVGLALARARRTPGGGAEVLAVVEASAEASGRVLLVRDGAAIAGAPFSLPAGSRVEVRIPDPKAPDLPIAYRVRLEVAIGTADDDPANDAIELGLPSDRPGVLLFGDLPPAAFASPGSGFLLRSMQAWEAGALEAADLVLLSSVSVERLGPARVEDLQRFAAGGGRVLILGGPQAWAAGGWAGSLAETTLSPLRVKAPEGKGTAIVLVLDKSGSTARGALASLVRAARVAARGLAPGERLAILPFAARPDAAVLAPGWVESGATTRLGELDASLENLSAGGGTDLVRALGAAADVCGAEPATHRRVILLTDGDPDHVPDREALAAVAARLARGDVRFGAVVSGMPTAAALLRETLAARPDDVVLLDRAGAIPDRLLRELSRARAEQERRPAPTSVTWLTPVDDDLARLAPTYVQALEATPDATVLAVADYADGARLPFAARRALGAGEVVAFAWGPEGEPDGAAAALSLRGFVRDLARRADRGLLADVTGGLVRVRLPAASGAGALETLQGPESARLLEVEPGVFEGELLGDRSVLRVRVPGRDGAEDVVRPLDLPALPPEEHRGTGVDLATLDRWARAGGGRRLAPGEEPDRGPSGPGTPLAPWLLLGALLFLLEERRLAEATRALARSSMEETP